MNNFFIAIFYITVSAFIWGLCVEFDFINKLNINPDTAFFLWSLKWWGYAVTAGINPFFTNLLYYPFGVNIAWTTSIPSLSLLFYPLTQTAGPVFSYNLITLLNLGLSGLGVYLITKELGNRTSTAIFAGILFMFSPYLWGQIQGHMNLFVVSPLIYIVYLYISLYKDKIEKWKYVLITGLLFAFMFGISQEITFSFIFFSFTGWIVGLFWFKKEKLYQLFTATAQAGLISIILVLPFIYSMLKDRTDYIFNNPDIYSTDLVNIFIPTQTNLILGQLFKDISASFTGNISEQGGYLGLPVVAVAVYFLIKRKYGFVVTLFLVTIVFSFGGYLHLCGSPLIKMPWYVLENLPFFKHLLPCRFSLYAGFFAVILVAFFVDKIKNLYLKIVVSVLFLILWVPDIKQWFYRPVSYREFIPAFISSDLYRQYIKKSEGIIVLPDYEAFYPAAPIWQFSSQFYFGLAQKVAGPVPEPLRDFYFFSSNINLQDPLTAYKIVNYTRATSVRWIIVEKKFQNLFAGLESIFGKPVVAEDCLLYPAQVSRSTFENIKNRYKRTFMDGFIRLINASETYLKKHPDSKLTPLNLIKEGLIPPDFGWHTGEAENWTKNGFWVGTGVGCRSCFGVGYVPKNKFEEEILAQEISTKAVKIIKENGLIIAVFNNP